MKFIPVIIVMSALALFTCTGDYNPFDDPSNAAMVTVADGSGILDSAAVPVYSTRPLVLMAAVRECIDSFSVHIDSNRAFTDTTVRNPALARYSFPVSLVDTGWKQAVITAYRRGGGRAVGILSLHAYSPLRQTDMDTLAGAQVTLSTPAVGDTVWYHWSYGDLLQDTVHSLYPQGTAVLGRAGTFAGLLWVSADREGRVRPAPADSFVLRVNDRSGPYIACMNDSVRGDTVIAGEDVFSLAFDISDAGGIAAALVNGREFEYRSTPRYMTTLRGMRAHPASAPLAVDVSATDYNGNNTSRRYYVIYDAALIDRSGTQITVESIRDTITTNRLTYMLVGSVRDYIRSLVDLTGTVNAGTVLAPRRIAMDSGAGYWYHEISLPGSYNTILLTARDTAGTFLTDKTITIFHDPDAVDTVAPAILDVMVNGSSVGQPDRLVFIESDTAVVTVVTFDNTGVKTVSVNGAAAPQPPAARPYEWTVRLGGIGHGDPTVVQVLSTDSLGTAARFRFMVQKNAVPSLPAGWQWPARLFAGSAATIPFTIADDDNDAAAAFATAPAAMTLVKTPGENTWSIFWTPSIADTGSYTVAVTLSDGKAMRTVYWPFTVLRDSSQMVRFATSAAVFPAVLQAGRDTLRQVLDVAAGSGLPQYRFRAFYAETGRTIFDSSSPAGTMALQIAPTVADTGLHSFMVVVTDGRGDGDTLRRDITVVPANQYPCSLAVLFPANAVMTADGAVDMGWALSPDTIRFSIADRDNPLTEAYTVTTEWSNMTAAQQTVAGRTFMLVLDTLSTRSRDTVRVIVSDLTGTRDTAVIRVSYMPFVLKKSFTVNTASAGGGAGVSAPVTSFPLVLRIPGNLLDSAAIKAGTQYLRFSRTGRETLRFEVERWAGAGDSTIIWVLADTVFGNDAGQVVQMAVTSTAAAVVSGGRTVFDTAAGYSGVWHLGRLTAVVPITSPDASAYANDMHSGTGVGNSNVVRGNIGNGFVFNGTSNYLRNPSPAASLQFTTQLSISAWVKPAVLDSSAYHDILGRRFGTSWSDAWLITIFDRKPCFVAGMSDTNRVYGTAVAAGQWTHIAGVRNGRDIRLYVNGQPAGVGTATAGAFSVDANDVSIGAQQNDATPGVFSEFFDGIIDEVRAEKTARSADWIKLNYETQKPGSLVVRMR